MGQKVPFLHQNIIEICTCNNIRSKFTEGGVPPNSFTEIVPKVPNVMV